MVRTYYIVFTDGKNKFLKFLKKGFKHVFICVNDDTKIMYLEDTFEGVFLGKWEKKDFNILTKQENWCVIVLKKEEESKKRMGIWHWAPTCVNFVKNIAGIRCRAQTPYQLYKYLLRKGHEKWEIK